MPPAPASRMAGARQTQPDPHAPPSPAPGPPCWLRKGGAQQGRFSQVSSLRKNRLPSRHGSCPGRTTGLKVGWQRGDALGQGITVSIVGPAWHAKQSGNGPSDACHPCRLPLGVDRARTGIPAQHARRNHARQQRTGREVGTQRAQHDRQVPMAAAEVREQEARPSRQGVGGLKYAA